ncbi:bulb-type lectin domain-containing protein [Artemisia annua]|uniref:Bulb-type lectin domain-containing protein n=1 Tax=Artemisia annua TaxID=35608 RepID=A0A2U1PPG9_ARTAN|nr:bulb-type lectin domain-containing protein [Artemisia annua]
MANHGFHLLVNLPLVSEVQGKDNFLLSIWYDKIPEKTIIWYPEGVLSDLQGRDVWSTGPPSDITYGVMNDTGNFVIVGNNSRKIWESFNFPTDTMLPTQVIEKGGAIYSKMSRVNFARGRFQLRLLQDGNLVLNTRDVASGFAYNAYYATKTDDPTNQPNSGEQLIFDATGFLYILRRNGKRYDLTPNQDRAPVW